jgi:hypothetical protein
MIKKLIVVAMLIATLGIGIESVAYAMSGSPGKQLGTGRKGRPGTGHRRHRRHSNAAASFTHVKQ